MADEPAIAARVGKPFSIALESVATAGYRWMVEMDQDAIELQRRTHEPALAVGGSLKEHFVFVPHKRGEFVIRLKYGRPWEERPHESRDLHVHVT
jgi:predicted secreted protein